MASGQVQSRQARLNKQEKGWSRPALVEEKRQTRRKRFLRTVERVVLMVEVSRPMYGQRLLDLIQLDFDGRKWRPKFWQLRNTPGVTRRTCIDIRRPRLTTLWCWCFRARWRTCRLLFSSSGLAATRGRYRPIIRLWFGFFLRLCGLFFFVHLFFYLQVLLFCPTALPAVLPVADQEVEAIGIDLHTWLKAYTKVAVIHLVLFDIGVKKVEVAGDGEEKVVMVGWQLRKLVFQHLRGGCCPLAFFSYLRLRLLREELIG